MITNRIRVFTEFVGTLWHYALKLREVMVSLLVLIIVGGVAISRLEDIRLGDAIYFAFITGLSIGYGDITPESTAGKIVSVSIGFIGILFVGLTVAIATRALADLGKREKDSKH
jgi:hypothetical protein